MKIKILFLIFVLLLSNLKAQTNFHDTKGELSVSGTGTANYSLPIAVPSGVKNISPQVSLVYNSSSDNGMAGYGWVISGISSISRVSARMDIDGYTAGVNLTSEDKFSLDGQRLILKSGSYGANGAAYQTENYSNLKIESIGAISATGVSGTCPEYFKVTFPDGTQVLYGSAADARGVTEWLIKKWKDPQGNFIEYTYSKDQNTSYISKIVWGGNETQSTGYSNTINFYYKTRTRPEFAYVAGVKIVNTKILDRIEVLAGSSLFKKYVLTHQTITGNYQRTASVQEFNGAGEAANPVTFTYNDTPNTFGSYTYEKSAALTDLKDIATTGDFDGDGKADVITYNLEKNEFRLYKNLMQTLGKTDKFIIDASGTTVTTLTNNKLNSFQSLLSLQHKNTSGVSNSYSYSDDTYLKGEKLVFYVKNLNKTTNKFDTNYTREVSYPYLGWETNSDKCMNRPGNFDKYTNPASIKLLEGDFNGDGISEVLVLGQISYVDYHVDAPWRNFMENKTIAGSDSELTTDSNKLTAYNIEIGCTAHYETRTVNSYRLDLNPQLSVQESFTRANILIPYDNTNYIVDFNGNGKSDILSISKLGFVSIYGLGTDNNFKELYNGRIPEYDGKKPLLIGDFNGDGKSDMMIPEKEGSTKWFMYISTGKGFEKQTYDNLTEYTPYWKGAPSANRIRIKNWQIADLNKDGKSDFIESDYESECKNIFAVNGCDRDGRGHIRYFENLGGAPKPIFAPRIESTSPESKYGYSDAVTLIIADYKRNEITGNYVFVQYGQIWKGNFNKDMRKDILLTKVSEAGGKVVSTVAYTPLVPNTANSGLGDANGTYYSSNSEIYPYKEIIQVPNMDVVSKLTVTAAGHTLYQQFKYFGLTTHAQGLGLLGFKKTARSNWQTDESIVKTAVWSVEEMYPRLGRDGASTSPLISSWAFKGANYALITNPQDNQLLSKKSVRFQTTQPSAKVYKNLPNYLLEKDFLTGISSTTDNTYDSYGNLSQSKVANGVSTVQTDYTYANNPSGVNAQYYIGRLTKKAAKITAYSDTFSTEENYVYTNNLITQTKKKGNNTDYITEAYSYDTAGNLVQKTISAPGVSARTIKDEYESSKRFVVKKTDVDGLTETFTYNNLGQVLTHTDPLGATTATAYDNWGKLTKATTTGASATALVTTTAYERTSDGGTKITSRNDAVGDYAVSYQDVFGKDIKSTVKGFATNTYISKSMVYDALGRKTQESEPYFEGGTPSQWNTFAYDDLSRLTKQTAFTGKTVTTTYSGLSATVNDGVKTKTATKDAAGNLVKVVDNGETVTYAYYANGGQKTANYNGHIVTTKQDGWGRKISLQDPSVSPTAYTYTYNNYGELLTETTPDGKTTYTYSPTGKVLTKTVTGNYTDISVNYTYTNKGLLSKEIGNSGGDANGEIYTYAYTYDSMYRLVSAKEISPYATYTKEYTYDAYSRLNNRGTTTITNNNITSTVMVQNGYNAWNGINDKILRVVAPPDEYFPHALVSETPIWELNSMNARMQILSAKLGNGVNLADTYDAYGYVTALKHTGTTASPLSLTYSFEAKRGLLNTRMDNYYGWQENFTYDKYDRLLSRSDPNGTQSNQYAADGRITNNSQVGAYAYDAAARYKKKEISLNATGESYYGSRSNLQITYNTYKNPVTITESSNSVQFEYNIRSSRSMMTVKTGTAVTKTKYYNDAKDVEIVTENGTTKIITYVDGTPYDAEIIYVKEAGNNTTIKAKEGFYYLHRDYQGSIMAISDSGGKVVERRHYDAWGNVVKLTDAAGQSIIQNSKLLIDRGYTGHEHLFSVGLIHMNGRLYDPVLHQFLSPDNNIQEADNPQNYNRYAYCLNNPLLYTDPSGEIFGLGIVLSAIVIGAIIGGTTYTAFALYAGNFSWGGFAKSVVIGGITGALGGAASLYAPIGILPGAGYGAATGGVIGMFCAAISGGNIVKGGILGAITGGIMGGVMGGVEAHKLGLDNIWTGTGTATVDIPLEGAGQVSSSSQYENMGDLDSDIKTYTGKDIDYVKKNLKVEDISLASEKNLPDNSHSFDSVSGMIKDSKNNVVGGTTLKQFKWGYAKSNSSKIWFSPGLKAYVPQVRQMVFNHEFIHAYHYSKGLYDNEYSEASASNYSYFYLKVNNMETQALQGFRNKVISYPSAYSWKPLAKIFNLGITPL
jgi:RHS repeat-associated protein